MSLKKSQEEIGEQVQQCRTDLQLVKSIEMEFKDVRMAENAWGLKELMRDFSSALTGWSSVAGSSELDLVKLYVVEKK